MKKIRKKTKSHSVKRLSIKAVTSHRLLAVVSVVIILGLGSYVSYQAVATKKPVKIATTASTSSGSNTVPICVEGEANCPTFGSSASQPGTTPASQSSQPTTLSQGTIKSTPTSTSITTTQTDNATKCAYFYSTMQPGAQSALGGIYNADIEQVRADIQQYNETPPGLTVDGVNADIQSLNNVQQADYNQQLVGIQTYAVTYGCSLTLTASPNLPLFNPPAAWNP